MGALAVPVLAFLPGDENIVDPAASRRMLAALPDCHIIELAEILKLKEIGLQQISQSSIND
mgnify:CR=1 FL=1